MSLTLFCYRCRRLNVVIFVTAVGALKGGDNNIAKVGDPRQQEARHTLYHGERGSRAFWSERYLFVALHAEAFYLDDILLRGDFRKDALWVLHQL